MSRNRMVNGELVPLSAEESAAMDAADAEWEATGKIAAVWKQVREERDAKLAETDWWAMPDSPTMSEAQTQYRQDLRDLPSTVDINNIVWPTKPE